MKTHHNDHMMYFKTWKYITWRWGKCDENEWFVEVEWMVRQELQVRLLWHLDDRLHLLELERTQTERHRRRVDTRIHRGHHPRRVAVRNTKPARLALLWNTCFHVVMCRLRGFVPLLFWYHLVVLEGSYHYCFGTPSYSKGRLYLCMCKSFVIWANCIDHRVTTWLHTWLFRSFLSKWHMVFFHLWVLQVFLCIISVSWHFSPWLSSFLFCNKRKGISVTVCETS